MEKLEKAAAPLQQPKNAHPSHAAEIAVQTRLAHGIQGSPRFLAQRKLNELANGSARVTAQGQFNATIQKISVQKVSAKTEHRRRAVQSAELAEEEEGTAQAKKAGGGIAFESQVDTDAATQ